jgi:hypothetical protein
MQFQALQPEAKILYAIRNPVTGFARAVSGFEDSSYVWHRDPGNVWFEKQNYYSLSHHARLMAAIVRDLNWIKTMEGSMEVISFETLHETQGLKLDTFLGGLGLAPHKATSESTFWGKRWRGDYKSKGPKYGFNLEPRRQETGDFYGFFDKLALRWLFAEVIDLHQIRSLNDNFPRFGSFRYWLALPLVLMVIAVPTRHERRALKYQLQMNRKRVFTSNVFWVFVRVATQLGLVFSVVRGRV